MGDVRIVGQQGEALTSADVLALQALGLDIKERLERYCREHNKPASVALGCVLGLVWGWTRRASLQEGSVTLASPASAVTAIVLRRGAEIWQACEGAEEKRQRGNDRQRFG